MKKDDVTKKKMKKLEKFFVEQLEKWVKIQKKNEKNLWYIG